MKKLSLFSMFLLMLTAGFSLASAQMTVTPINLVFGDQAVGTKSKMDVEIGNAGTEAFTVFLNITPVSGKFDVCESGEAADTCTPITEIPDLLPETSQTIDIQYHPDVAGVHGATLQIVNDRGESQPVNLEGHGVHSEIVLAFDVSGSMGWAPVGRSDDRAGGIGSRLWEAQESSKQLVDKISSFTTAATEMAIVRFPGSTTTFSASHMPLTIIQGNELSIKANLDTLTVHWNGTPMKPGLEEALNTFSGNPHTKRTILLLSNGAYQLSYGGEPRDLLNSSHVPNLVSPPTIVYSLGYGQEDGTEDNLDTQTLFDMANGTEGKYFHYDPQTISIPDPNQTIISDYLSFFDKIVAEGLSLQQSADPLQRISLSQNNRHPVYITSFDRKVAFTLSWSTPFQNMLRLELITPDGITITPERVSSGEFPGIEYVSGETYQIYFVDQEYLQDPKKLGEWQLSVTYAKPVGRGEPKEFGVASMAPFLSKEETYGYSVLMDSELTFDARLVNQNIMTGDTVFFEAQLLKTRDPVKDAKVIIRVERPDDGLGNWHAKNLLSEEELKDMEKRIPSSVSGEAVPRSVKKGYYLTRVKKIPLPETKRDTAPITLHDDGKNGDRVAGDGIYSGSFTDTSKQGTYSFKFIARGKDSPEGNLKFRREELIQIYVPVKVAPDFTASPLHIERITVVEDQARYSVKITPKDRLGNHVGPGYANMVSFATTEGRLIGDVVDDLEGGYYQIVEFSRAVENPIVSINVKGVEFPRTHVVKPSPFPNYFWILLLLMIVSIVLLAYLVWTTRGR